MNSFNTIESEVQSELKVRGSRFIGLAWPMSHENELKSFLSKAHDLFPNATHYCFAYRIVRDGQIHERASDDGEPFNSSGPPILRAMESYDVFQTLVIVVRYYGGKKLGVPGLKEAYGEAGRQALSLAKIKKVEPEFQFWMRPKNAFETFKAYEIIERYGLKLITAPETENGFFICSAREQDRATIMEITKNEYTFEFEFKPPSKE